MVSNRADAVRLADGDIAHIIKGGAKHPLTRQPLGDGQLLLLLREMAPPDVIPTLGSADVEFIYANGEGRFVTRVSRENGTLQAMVSAAPVNSNGNGNGSANGVAAHNGNGHAPSPVEVAPARPTPPVNESVAYVKADRAIDQTARAEIESLLRMLVQEGGSDLHLRVGEPPILRLHGELMRLEHWGCPWSREPDGRVAVIEANPNPWLASKAEFAMAARKSGRNYTQLIEELVELAMARYGSGS